MKRKITREVRVGSIIIGGNAPISIQSMTNTDTRDAVATIAQIHALEAAGCELVRVAVPDNAAADALPEIIRGINIPLAADIHFDYRLALRALEAGVAKLRINPGNIGSKNKVEKVVALAKERHVPIRIGVNSGSVEKDLLQKHGSPTPEALVESAMRHVHILEELDFRDIIISVKSSSVKKCFEAYSLLSETVDYPLHIGITEAGTLINGTIKSSAGLGALLLNGVGDTIRISLTSDPVDEVACAKKLLQYLELRQFGPEFIFCPTCGRTEIPLISLATEVEKRCSGLTKNLKIAVMGCVVNGPGEAHEADIGIAGGKDCGIIFKRGEIVRKTSADKLLGAFLEELQELI